MNIDINLVTGWMTYLRNHPENRDRFLECFWPSQIESKKWLLEKMDRITLHAPKNVFVFGGWYGIFAQILKNKYPQARVVSIDSDPSCADIGRSLTSEVEFVTQDMALYQYDEEPSVVINTATEHIDQFTYEDWWDKVPKNTMYFLQGNNFFECKEHIRCSTSMEHFFFQCNIKYSILQPAAELDCKQFTRYMIYGYKR